MKVVVSILVLILIVHIIYSQRVASLTIVCEELRRRTYLRVGVDWYDNTETNLKEVKREDTD
jgi:hypothetical protein